MDVVEVRQLLAYLTQSRDTDRLTGVLRDFFTNCGFGTIGVWLSLAQRAPNGDELFTTLVVDDGISWPPNPPRLMTQREITDRLGCSAFRCPMSVPALDDSGETPVLLMVCAGQADLASKIPLLTEITQHLTRELFNREADALWSAVMHASLSSKDLTSFFYKCLHSILLPRFGFQAGSLFYYESSIDALVLGATTGLTRMEQSGLKRSDIKYFVDGKSYTARAFVQREVIVEDTYWRPLPLNNLGEKPQDVYSRINLPLRVKKSSSQDPLQSDPIGVFRGVNANSHLSEQPITTYQMALLEVFGEVCCAFARRYIRVSAVLHDQERATHGYFTDLLTIKLAASTIMTTVSRLNLNSDSDHKMALTVIQHRCSDVLAVQDNMAQQLMTVTRHISNAWVLPKAVEAELCTHPFKDIFLRVIAAKKGMSECYNRRELVIESQGIAALDDQFKSIPPLNITIGALYLIVRNIVENTIKYTDKVETPRLDIQWKQNGRHVEFSFRDYGIGIPERERAFIFREGFRGFDAQSLQLRGNGLGLAVSKNVVEQARGRLEYHTPRSGPGSVFTVTLPIV